ncbi:hypothetical protein GCM10023194_59250 [Planotetraspora phitsanulokensis]|uniref:Uncharacterized protein n=1 Tax=Planotetraspora phitsanulokensis TaxID=575192 RepID=A0A8J3XHZ0_9ACTN|nr:hypothetical protein Pph01_53890 [Planotetraspora phitsanulokensis]
MLPTEPATVTSPGKTEAPIDPGPRRADRERSSDVRQGWDTHPEACPWPFSEGGIPPIALQSGLVGRAGRQSGVYGRSWAPPFGPGRQVPYMSLSG